MTGGTIGTQSRTIVTILDDDEMNTCSNKSSLRDSRRDLWYVEAGTPFEFNVNATTCAGTDQTIGGDMWKVEASIIGSQVGPHEFDTPATEGRCEDSGDGIYACAINPTSSGTYKLDIYQLIPGGLKGYYYTDNYLSHEKLDNIRTDAVINFTWGAGAVATFGKDFVSVRWEGFVRPLHSEMFTFWLEVDDHARLWVDGYLLIDSWTFSPSSGMLQAQHELTAHETHEVVLEYREILGNASARLLWSSTNTNMTVIPSKSLFHKVRVTFPGTRARRTNTLPAFAPLTSSSAGTHL